ncbi:LysR family transcriptional regulator [Leucobacter luti]|uniref:LysR family transcriptional regulator n=1 Tax=Leucobacter luti TaxID=340320 RepID=UPI003CFF197E
MSDEAASDGRYSSLTLRQLECFLRVASTLNFRRAAETLFLSQPSLSRQISSLEAILGVPLLRRTTRSVALTPQGSQLLALATELLADANEGIALARGAVAFPGVIRVYHHAEGSALATRIGGMLRSSDPESEIHQHEVRGEELGQIGRANPNSISVDAGETDAAETGAAGSGAFVIAKDQVVAALPADHPFFGVDRLAARDLRSADAHALGPADAPGLHAVLARHGIRPRQLESGAEERAFLSGGILIDLASRWPNSTSRFRVAAIEGLEHVVFSARSTSAPLLARLGG